MQKKVVACALALALGNKVRRLAPARRQLTVPVPVGEAACAPGCAQNLLSGRTGQPFSVLTSRDQRLWGKSVPCECVPCSEQLRNPSVSAYLERAEQQKLPLTCRKGSRDVEIPGIGGARLISWLKICIRPRPHTTGPASTGRLHVSAHLTQVVFRRLVLPVFDALGPAAGHPYLLAPPATMLTAGAAGITSRQPACPAQGRAVLSGPPPAKLHGCVLRCHRAPALTPAAGPRRSSHVQQAVGGSRSSDRHVQAEATLQAEATVQVERPAELLESAVPRTHIGPPAYVKATGRIVASECRGRVQACGAAGCLCCRLPPAAQPASASAGSQARAGADPATVSWLRSWRHPWRPAEGAAVSGDGGGAGGAGRPHPLGRRGHHCGAAGGCAGPRRLRDW